MRYEPEGDRDHCILCIRASKEQDGSFKTTTKPNYVVHHDFKQEKVDDEDGKTKYEHMCMEQFVCRDCFNSNWRRGSQKTKPEFTYIEFDKWIEMHGKTRDW